MNEASEGWDPDLPEAMDTAELLKSRRWAFTWKADGDHVRAVFCRDGKLAQGRAKTLSLAILNAVVCAVAIERGNEGVRS